MPLKAKSILALCQYTLAFIWLYQGLVPKLLGPDVTELQMDLALGVSTDQAVQIARAAGAMEIVIGIVVLACGKHAWPYWLTVVLIVGLTGYVIAVMPHLFTGAFNPAITNVAMAALAYIAILASQATEGSVHAKFTAGH